MSLLRGYENQGGLKWGRRLPGYWYLFNFFIFLYWDLCKNSIFFAIAHWIQLPIHISQYSHSWKSCSRVQGTDVPAESPTGCAATHHYLPSVSHTVR